MISKARHRIIWLLALVLLISVCATTIAFANIIGEYNIDDSGAISLLGEAESHVSTGTVSDTGALIPETEPVTEAETEIVSESTSAVVSDQATPAVPGARPGFEASDDATVWSTDTKIEIFRVSYENGDHVITVNSSDGDKLIAPGTENSYTFKLKNTGNVPLSYKVEVNAYFEPAGISIPVTARLSRHDGKWITDGDGSFVSVADLDVAEDSAELGAGRFTYYTLDWQWPYESGNDEFDTLLGNMAVDEDLTFTIEIITVAEYDGEIGDDIGIIPPETGDNTSLAMWITIAVASLAIIVVLLIIDRREKRSHLIKEA